MLLRKNLEVVVGHSQENLSMSVAFYCRMHGASENKMMGEIPRRGH